MKKTKYFGVLTVSAISKSGGNPDEVANHELTRFGFRAENQDASVSKKARPKQGNRFILESTFLNESAGEFRLLGSDNGSWQEYLSGRIANYSRNVPGGLSVFELVGGCFSELKILTPLDAIANTLEKVPTVDSKTLLGMSSISIDEHGNEFIGEDKVTHLQTDDVRPAAFQPRTYFNNERLEALADSIVEWGLQKPIIVRLLNPEERGNSPCHYEIIGGERRWRAHKSRGLKTIKCIIRKGGNLVDLYTAAFMDNHHNEATTPYENIRAIHWFFDQLKDVAEIHRRTGFKVIKIKEYLKLRTLNPEIIEMMSPEVPEEKRLRIGHARTLSEIPDQKKQMQIYEQSYRQVDRGIRVVGRVLKSMVVQAKRITDLPIRGKGQLRQSAARSSSALIHAVIDLDGNYDGFRSHFMMLDEHSRHDVEGSIRTAMDKLPRLLTVIDELNKKTPAAAK